MKLAKTILCMISITLIMVLSCGKDEKPSQPVDKFTIDDFHNAVGTHWLYGIEISPSGLQGITEVHINDTTTLFGSESATTWIFSDSDQYFADIQFVSIVGDSVRYYCDRCSVPYRILIFPLEVGKSWQADVMEGEAFCKVQAIVDISVPAGEFKTYRVYIDLPPSDMFPETNEKTTLWISPEVGMVKMERVTEPVKEIWELVLYQLPD